MPATLFDSAIWRGVLFDQPIATLFTDTAILRAELLVMGTLAQTQARAGTLPEISAQAIQRAAMEIQVDPAALSDMTAQTGDPVAALVAQFRSEMKSPEHAAWVHHAGDSASLQATALSLRLRQVIGQLASRLDGADKDTLEALKPQVLLAYHPDADLRHGLAEGLGLTDAGATAPAAAIAVFAAWAGDMARTHAASSDVTKTLAQTIPALTALLDRDASPLTIAMVLPQVCLSLGVILR